MKLTYRQLLDSLGDPANNIPGAFARFNSAEMPLKTAIAMKPIARAVQQHYADYNEIRLGLCEKHGTLDASKNTYEFGKNQAAFDRDFAELLAGEITIDAPRIKPSQLLSSMVIKGGDLMLLDWLIDDGTSEDVPAPEAAESAAA